MSTAIAFLSLFFSDDLTVAIASAPKMDSGASATFPILGVRLIWSQEIDT